jgi:hypothetical protein
MNALGRAMMTTEEADSISQWFSSNIDSELTYCLAQFLCRPYWARIWIVQELAMSGENSIIICGHRRFPTTPILRIGKRFRPLESLAATANLGYTIGRLYDPKSKGIPIGSLIDGFKKLRNLSDLRNNLDEITSEDVILNSLWFQTASRNDATDPRDLVYGMINLLPSGLVSYLRVEYSYENTYQRITTDFATAHICNWRGFN